MDSMDRYISKFSVEAMKTDLAGAFAKMEAAKGPVKAEADYLKMEYVFEILYFRNAQTFASD
jgi:hypothetical protein